MGGRGTRRPTGVSALVVYVLFALATVLSASWTSADALGRCVPVTDRLTAIVEHLHLMQLASTCTSGTLTFTGVGYFLAATLLALAVAAAAHALEFLLAQVRVRLVLRRILATLWLWLRTAWTTTPVPTNTVDDDTWLAPPPLNDLWLGSACLRRGPPAIA